MQEEMYIIHLTLSQKSIFRFLVAIFSILEPNLAEKAVFELRHFLKTFVSSQLVAHDDFMSLLSVCNTPCSSLSSEALVRVDLRVTHSNTYLMCV